MSAFAIKWFTVYYFLFGALLIGSGLTLAFRPERSRRRLLPLGKDDTPPALLKRILRYILIFTLPNLVLAFFPFSWIELLAALFSLMLVYLLGSMLLRWPQIKPLLAEHRDQLGSHVRTAGATLLALGLAMLSLGFRILEQHLG